MDPNETLQKIRNAYHDYITTNDAETANNAAEIIANGFSDLDEWLSKGGFLPRDWRME